MKRTIAVLVNLLIVQISFAQKANPDVKIYGEMRKIAFQIDTTAKFDLKTLEGVRNVYGLGIVSGMNGEIIVVDSKPLITQVVNNQRTKSKQSFNVKSTLFGYATVGAWTKIAIPEGIDTYKKLQEFVISNAAKQGTNTDQPFPFLIKGTVTSVGWQVSTSEGTTTESHLKQGLHSSSENVQVELVGILSKKHQAVFTHHDEFMHVHGKLADNSLAFHVEKISLGSNCLLFIPSNEN